MEKARGLAYSRSIYLGPAVYPLIDAGALVPVLPAADSFWFPSGYASGFRLPGL